MMGILNAINEKCSISCKGVNKYGALTAKCPKGHVTKRDMMSQSVTYPQNPEIGFPVCGAICL